jgi:hypothetical protein
LEVLEGIAGGGCERCKVKKKEERGENFWHFEVHKYG